ncbi:hypothetical protein Fmac_032405 [Flemingia macrophylla]|uniref:Uncharacterized protein n=1 Tax=Flemingia macrophylla TaxID=520843 RepID=A0ABD1L4U2_9FABA
MQPCIIGYVRLAASLRRFLRPPTTPPAASYDPSGSHLRSRSGSHLRYPSGGHLRDPSAMPFPSPSSSASTTYLGGQQLQPMLLCSSYKALMRVVGVQFACAFTVHACRGTRGEIPPRGQGHFRLSPIADVAFLWFPFLSPVLSEDTPSISLSSQMNLTRFSYCLLFHTFDDSPSKTSNLVMEITPSKGTKTNAVTYTPFSKNENAAFGVYY